MNNKKSFSAVVAFVLCVVMVLAIVLGALVFLKPVDTNAAAAPGNNFDITNFDGLKFSLIGDSISTFDGINNNEQYNPGYYTYGGVESKVHYTAGKWGVQTYKETWWQQACDVLGMDLLVNNAWSASAVATVKGDVEPAYLKRSAYLHNGSTNPDIIALYLGTNDCSSLTDTSALGTVNSSMISTAESFVNNNKTETTYNRKILEAYAIMLYRAIKKYPSAEIYCFTLLPENSDVKDSNEASYLAFNAGVKALVDHYAGKGNFVYLVDLYNDCGISTDRISRDHTLGDNLHPGPAGMDAITNCLVSSMMKNSPRMKGTATYSVNYNKINTYVEVGNVFNGSEMYGDVTTAVAGKPFRVELGNGGIENIDFTVTMGGKDITKECVHGDIVTIDSVTGDIVITAEEAPDNYYWVEGTNGLRSNPDVTAEFTYNSAVLLSGKYSTSKYGITATDGDAQFQLSQPIMLHHTRPWVMEFEAQGYVCTTGQGGYEGGILLASNTPASADFGNTYIHLNQTHFLLGYHDANGGYSNAGVTWDAIATKLGSSAGAEIRNQKLKFRMVNNLKSDGSNKIDLYVNDKYIGDMHTSVRNDASITGVDFVFNYFGTSNHPLQACSLNYVKVYENGIGGVARDEVHNFLWEGVGEYMTSVADDDYFTENVLDPIVGTGVNGVHKDGTAYSLDKPVHLLHDRPWTVEFRAMGPWSGSGDNMLFSTVNEASRHDNAPFLWRNHTDFICFGSKFDGTDGTYQNYGVDMLDLGLVDSEFYVYRLQNKIETDANGAYVKNMVYLYVDDVEIGPMTTLRSNNNDTGTTGEWINGKDLVFNFLGNEDFPLHGVTFDYIQVWESGSGIDTSRLDYLIANRLDSHSSYDPVSWGDYIDALTAAQELLKDVTVSQDKIDAAVSAIMAARNALVKTDVAASKIYSVELVTGPYARVGKQTGLKVITSPDIAQVCIGTQKLLINSSKIQKLMIDGTETEVKVWLVGFMRSATTEETITYGVGAYKEYDASHTGHKDSDPDVYTSIVVPYKAKYVTGISVATQPEKTVYFVGEDPDAAGLTMNVTWSDGTTTVESTGFYIHETRLQLEDELITIDFDGATATCPIRVVDRVSVVLETEVDKTVTVRGAFVGVADEGNAANNDILLKDPDSDTVITVRVDADLSASYVVGDMLIVTGIVRADGYDRYLEASSVESEA